ncbi:SMI1/KNR4 family protein [Actinoplanes sp. NPDC026670]|uniref:SMI1/KNR4 family protein n=1 Tax=Actinoplanes sp. NPDC026670 TaxID=3154700 RepID=UPI0033E00F54
MTIQDLIELCPPPSRDGRADLDWPAFESRFGRSLPGDYREICTEYGPGQFGEFIFIYLPESDSVTQRIEIQSREASQDLRDLPEEDNLFDFPFSSEDLLLCGVTDNGDFIWWVTGSEDPDKWTVVVTEAGFGEWFHFEGGLADFLYAVLSGAVEVPLFPDDLLPLEVGFAPLDDA